MTQSKTPGAGLIAATVLGSGVAMIDGSVVNVALPAMGHELDGGAAGVQWIVNGFLLPLAALVLLGGALADRVGRRPVFLSGIALFGAAALGCMVAPGFPLVLAARVLQGIAAALLVPASLAILGAEFSGAARARAIGTWAAAGAAGGAIGPILGGFLVDRFGWRSIFVFVAAVALAAFLAAWRYVPAGREADAGKPDWLGALLATAGLAALALGLTFAGDGRAAMGLPIAGGGVVLLGLFLMVERRRGDAAMVPLKLFGTRSFTGLTFLTFQLYAALGGAMVLIPFLLISRGWSAAAAGAALLPLPLLIGAGSRFAGALGEKVGARPMLTVGPVVVAAGFAWLGRMPEGGIAYWRDLFPTLLLAGIGMTIAVAPLTNAVMASVDEHRSGAASGVNNATARVGGMIAVALIGLVLSDGGRDVSTTAFRIAGLTAAAMALLAAASAWLLTGTPATARDTASRGSPA